MEKDKLIKLNSFIVDNKLVFFDQEWNFPDIPVGFILFYAIRQSYISFRGYTDITLDDIYIRLNMQDHT